MLQCFRQREKTVGCMQRCIGVVAALACAVCAYHMLTCAPNMGH